jgi:hypothetical protein
MGLNSGLVMALAQFPASEGAQEDCPVATGQPARYLEAQKRLAPGRRTNPDRARPSGTLIGSAAIEAPYLSVALYSSMPADWTLVAHASVPSIVSCGNEPFKTLSFQTPIINVP